MHTPDILAIIIVLAYYLWPYLNKPKTRTIDHTAAIKPSMVSSALVSMPAGFIR